MPIRRLEGGKTATSTPPSLAWQGGEVRGEVETRWRLFCSQHNSQKAVREKMRKMKRLLYSTANADEAVSRWRKVTTPTKHPHLWSGRTERCGGDGDEQDWRWRGSASSTSVSITSRSGCKEPPSESGPDDDQHRRQRVPPIHRRAVVWRHRWTWNREQMKTKWPRATTELVEEKIETNTPYHWKFNRRSKTACRFDKPK